MREDNADIRLSHYGYKLGLIDEQTYDNVVKKQLETKEGLAYLEETVLTPSKENIAYLEELGEEKITDKVSLQKIVARKSFDLEKLEKLSPIFEKFSLDAKKQILVEAKYKNYIEKQKIQIDKMKNLMNIKIPPMMDFSSISGLSNEVVEKLQRFSPPTLFAASEISGITPSAIDILHVYVTMSHRRNKLL